MGQCMPDWPTLIMFLKPWGGPAENEEERGPTGKLRSVTTEREMKGLAVMSRDDPHFQTCVCPSALRGQPPSPPVSWDRGKERPTCSQPWLLPSGRPTYTVSG